MERLVDRKEARWDSGKYVHLDIHIYSVTYIRSQLFHPTLSYRTRKRDQRIILKVSPAQVATCGIHVRI